MNIVQMETRSGKVLRKGVRVAEESSWL